MPLDLNNELTVLGQTSYRNQRRKFGIYPKDRRQHVYVIGKTGVGKSTLLENMISQDIMQGRGVCYVDPHGDTVERLLDCVPPQRVNDVVYFDPSDVEYPVAFNVLEAIDPAYKYLIASGLVSSLKKMWADSWGPRLEYILRNTILALLDYPSSTILGILRMLADKDYRKKVVTHISDPVIKAFWTTEFANYNERFRTEAISPIQNKVGQLLSSSIIRNIMAQPKSTIDMKDIMNSGKIFLVNVSKGKIGEDNSALLGAMIINRIQLAAMDRASVLEEERHDFYLYVDEFQNFATESFADILSEARKYHLNLTVAHQYVAQMEEEVSDAVFGNVGTLISFRVGATDAEYLEQEFAPVFMQSDLVNLDKYHAYIKLMINGIASKPFSMQTLPPVLQYFGKAETVRRVSRERYGQEKSIVEDKIRRWSGIALAEKGVEEGGSTMERTAPRNELRTGRTLPPPRKPAMPAEAPEALEDITLPVAEPISDLSSLLKSDAERRAQKRPSAFRNNQRPRDNRPRWPIVCQRCGKQAEVPFEPDPNKPVYCQDCLVVIRAEKKQAPVAAPARPAHPKPNFNRGPTPPPLR